jgi:hypothetical protein
MQRNLYLSSTYLQLHVLHPLLWNVLVRMHQYNESKIDGLRTWPEFEKGMYFYVPVGVILIELEDCSDYATGIEPRSLLHDETEFVDDTMSQTRTTLPCIGYDGTRAELSSGEY